MYGYIYKTTNKINGKIYIGQHLATVFEPNKYLGSGTLLFLAIEKYGKENFKNELLCECENQEELDYYERFYIQKFNSQDKTIGYNITPGDFGGSGPLTEQTKQKLRESQLNKILIHKENKCIKILCDDLDKYIALGWEYGNKEYQRAAEFGDKKRKEQLGRIGIHNALTGEKLRVWESELPKYFALGYSLDWGKKVSSLKTKERKRKSIGKEKPFKWMNKDDIYKMIGADCQLHYLQEGWVFGNKKRPYQVGSHPSEKTRLKLSLSHIGKKPTKEAIEKQAAALRGRVVIHKAETTKLVPAEQLNEYLELGWMRGRYKTVNSRSRKVICIETEEVFNSITSAAKAKTKKGIRFESGIKMLYYCLNNDYSKTAVGYHWAFESDTNRITKIKKLFEEENEDE